MWRYIALGGSAVEISDEEKTYELHDRNAEVFYALPVSQLELSGRSYALAGCRRRCANMIPRGKRHFLFTLRS